MRMIQSGSKVVMAAGTAVGVEAEERMSRTDD